MSGLSRILLRNLRGGPLNGLDVAIEHGCITVVRGCSGSGRTALLLEGLCAQTDFALAPILGESAPHHRPIRFDLSCDSVDGLLPPIPLGDLGLRRPRHRTIGALMRYDEALLEALRLRGELRCPDHDIALAATDIRALVVSVLEHARLHSPTSVVAVVCVALPRTDERSQIRRWAEYHGVRRLLTGGQTDSAMVGIEDFTSSAGHDAAALAITGSMAIDPAALASHIEPRFREVIDEALSIGSVAVVRLLHGPSGEGSGRILAPFERRVASGLTCPDCGFAVRSREATIERAAHAAFGFGEMMHRRRKRGPRNRTTDTLASDVPLSEPRVVLDGHPLHEWAGGTVQTILEYCRALVDPCGQVIGDALRVLTSWGLEDLRVGRLAQTLSPGEWLKCQCAVYEQSGVTDSVVLLDDVSVRLHPADIGLVVDWVKRMRTRGSTIVCADNDDRFVSCADAEIVLSQPGSEMGEVDREVLDQLASVSGWLRVTRKSGFHGETAGVGSLAPSLNLPLGTMTAIVGVAGAGRTQWLWSIGEAFSRTGDSERRRAVILVDDPGDASTLPMRIHGARSRRGDGAAFHAMVRGEIIGESLGVWPLIAEILATTPAARRASLGVADFLVHGGSALCANCRGAGVIRDRSFAGPIVPMTCRVCGGERFERRVLEIEYNGCSVGAMLRSTVASARALFRNQRELNERFSGAMSSGAGALVLGDSCVDISPRVMSCVLINDALARANSRSCVLLLDQALDFLEPKALAGVMERLRTIIGSGATVVVTTHSRDVVRASTWLIELSRSGPPSEPVPAAAYSW